MTLSIPDDHPVRKLFQRFRQQRDGPTPEESQVYFDQNFVQVEPQHHQHTDSKSYTQCQPVSPQQQEYISTVQNSAPCTGGGGAASKGSITAPPQGLQALVHTKKSEQEVGESRSRPCGENQLCLTVNSTVQRSGTGGEGTGGGATSRGGARGWGKFKKATCAAPPPPVVEHEKQPQKPEDWPKGSQSSEQLAAVNKNQDSEESGEVGSSEGSKSAGEAGEETSLHKTDSCDSGITKSDLRIDRAGDSRSSFERSPMEKSPMERNPFEHSLGVDSLKHTLVQPVSEQALLQATLHEAKLELKADIQMMSGRLSVLESHVSEILRLLSLKRRLSLPPTSSPKARVKSHDSVTASAASPKPDDGPF